MYNFENTELAKFDTLKTLFHIIRRDISSHSDTYITYTKMKETRDSLISFSFYYIMQLRILDFIFLNLLRRSTTKRVENFYLRKKDSYCYYKKPTTTKYILTATLP